MNEEYYIDCDGVLIDSQEYINREFEKYGSDSKSPAWNLRLKTIDWIYILSISKELDNSFDVLKELYKLKKKAYILSRVFSKEEAYAKINFFLKNGIFLDFIPVFGRVPKSGVIKPTPSKILIDDSKDNILDWRKNNGTGILVPGEEKDIKFLLKRL